ncbi:MAG: 3-oxoacyl-[acyl-carrier-protein] reductase [Trichlorobacter sp.]|jgi:3-oxoacyl-[acyl-carrier protein] reductase
MPQGKVAIVTGASRGIGKSIACALAAQGAVVVCVGTNQDALDSVVAEITATGGRASSVAANIALVDDCERIISYAHEQYGSVDILVNNAGVTRDGMFLKMKDEDWDTVINTNLKGAFMTSRAAWKVMSKQRYGRIINITSIVGQMGNAGQANYCASKGGLIAMTKSNAREMAKRNVTVNAVAPGFITTAMTEGLPDKVKESLSSQIPLERFGTPEDIAHAVVFLASSASGYITGQILGVNGGMYM